MSKKNSIVKNLNKQLQENKNFNEAYNSFEKNLKDIKSNKFVVGVSGGPDSLALSAFVEKFKYENKVKVFYVHINHNIRKKSKLDAFNLKKLLKKFNLNLIILTVKKKISKNIQNFARLNRYELFSRFCNLKQVKYILVGHHSDDQVETFLIRLSRGSGVKGLSSMQPLTKINKNIQILRPLLELRKSTLMNISKKIFKKIFKDPSNQDDKFLRTKIRRLTKQLEKSGISHSQVIKSIKNLGISSNTLENYVNSINKKIVNKKKKFTSINFKKLMLYNQEIRLKILSNAIKNVSESYYPPRSKKVLNLMNRLKLKKVKKHILAGCDIRVDGANVLVRKLT